MRAIFSSETIATISHGTGKADALAGLVRLLAHSARLPWESVGGITEALQMRERYCTTGLGKGLALPHLCCRDVPDFVGAIGVAPTGIDFHSLDGLPTRLIILLLSPAEQRERHGEILGRLATLLSNRTLQYSMQLPRSPEVLFRFLGF
jgi:mannitol/fructose-specific phosphotransferase system IIA component (Ntr-type)